MNLFFPASALLYAVSLATPGAGLNRVETDLIIAHHEDVPIDEKAIAAILAIATEALEKKDSDADTECPVRFVLKPKLIKIDRTKLPYTLSHFGHFAQLAKLPGDVKVVGHINWCGTNEQHYWGCAGPVPGMLAVVPLDDAATAGVLWAHEFAHCKGLGHMSANRPNHLMVSGIRAKNRELNSPDCQKLLTPSLCGGKAGPDAKSFARLIARRPLARERPLPPVEDFIRRYWVHGVPYEIASRYGRDAGEKLVKVLADGEQRQYWVNAVTVLGMMGDDEFAEPLIAFFRRGTGELDFAETHAKIAVPLSLGMIANRSGSARAEAYLVELSRPRAAMPGWFFKGQKNREDQASEISTNAAIGIALSGPKAEARLNEILSSIGRGSFALNVVPSQPSDLVKHLQALHRQVREQGLEAYLGQPRMPNP